MLSKETIERIDNDAKEYAIYESQCINSRWRELYAKYNIMDYIAGATAEATRYEQERKELRETLESNAVEFCDWIRKNNYSQGVRFGLWGVDTDSTDMKVYTTSELYQKFIATKALNPNQ